MKFEFGTGISSYQVEGAYQEDGKLPSIWDTLSHQEGNITDKSNGDVATDFYHRYEEDIKLAKELGIQSFRFSFSMCRILEENGRVNHKGIEFYQRVVDCILKYGLEPVVTLYHWDLPQFLQDRGGFVNARIVDYYAKYVETVAKAFKGKIKTWITFNEPQCFIGLGYSGKEHAPKIHASLKEIIKASHNVLLCHAKAYQILKGINPNCLVTFVNTFSVNIPVTKDKKLEVFCYQHTFDIPENENQFYNTVIFTDPLYLGCYPKEYVALAKKNGVVFSKEDMALIKLSRPDRIDINIYSGNYFCLDEKGDVQYLDQVKEEEITSFDWLRARPKVLYYGPKYFYQRYHLPIVISENGVCYEDEVDHDAVHDEKRSKFILDYFAELKHAIHDGIDIKGYYYWSLEDNFEWAFGYSKRFGLVYIDYDNGLKRIKKDSFYTYQKLINESKNG